MGSAIGRIWKLHGDGRSVGPGGGAPDERLHTPNMLGLGAQHVLPLWLLQAQLRPDDRRVRRRRGRLGAPRRAGSRLP